MLFNLIFVNNTILSCFFHFLLIIDLYFLIPAVVAQIFNPIVERGNWNLSSIKEEIETYRVTAKPKISKFSM